MTNDRHTMIFSRNQICRSEIQHSRFLDQIDPTIFKALFLSANSARMNRFHIFWKQYMTENGEPYGPNPILTPVFRGGKEGCLILLISIMISD